MIIRIKKDNWIFLAGALFWFIYLLILCSKAVLVFIDHDEHQFIAAAALMAREGLVPFLDFPYIHSPYFSSLLSLFYEGNIPLLLSARFLNTLFSAVLIAIFIRTALINKSLRIWEIILALLIPMLFLSTNIFLYTSSHAWNHPPSILMIVSAFMLLPSLEKRKPHIIVFQALLAAGGCLMRLSYAPLGVLFFILVLRKLGLSRKLLFWFGGVIVAFIPMIVWAGMAMDEFLFGLWHFHTEIDPQYFIKTGVLTEDDSVFKAFGILISERDTLPFLIAFLSTFVIFIFNVINGNKHSNATWGALLFLVLALSAALMKGIVFTQYLALPMIFAFLFMLNFWLKSSEVYRKVLGIILLASSLISIGINYPSFAFWRVYILSQPDKWTALNIHKRSVSLLEQLNPEDQVFTLSPMFPAEAGVSFEPLLVNGPFLWRTAFIPDRLERQKYDMIGEEKIEYLFEKHQYKGVMLGHEEPLERKLKQFIYHQYDSIGAFNGMQLYIRRDTVLPEKVERLSHTSESLQ